METVIVDYKNIDDEHICCSLSDSTCVKAKKEWMKNNFEDGLVFRKANVRGKFFIEYMPGDDAWCPIEAPQYMFINCLWVAGKYQGKGGSKVLLRECIGESKIKGKKGLVALTSPSKRPYMADKKFLEHCGFKLADTAAPYFELMYLPFEDGAEPPKFLDTAVKGETEEMGWVLYYSHQCPFTAKYVPIAKSAAQDLGVELKTIRFDIPRDKNSLVEETGTMHPKESPSPYTAYSLFHNGKFITHEVQTAANITKLIQDSLNG
ncbi:MAG: YoaP domain-containing protein [Clostridiales bacterium]